MARTARGKSRVVLAPEPELTAGQDVPNRVLSVNLKSGEDVEWLWTSLPFGGKYVRGYRILKIPRSFTSAEMQAWIEEDERDLAAYRSGS